MLCRQQTTKVQISLCSAQAGLHLCGLQFGIMEVLMTWLMYEPVHEILVLNYQHWQAENAQTSLHMSAVSLET